MTMAEKIGIWLGVFGALGTIAGIIVLAKTGEYGIIAVSAAVITLLGISAWGFLGSPVSFGRRLIVSFAVLIAASFVLAIMVEKSLSPGALVADFSSDGVRIFPVGAVPGCNATISGEAPLVAGKKVWVAHKEVGRTQYYFTAALSLSPSSRANVVMRFSEAGARLFPVACPALSFLKNSLLA